jgi:hypothetical protein
VFALAVEDAHVGAEEFVGGTDEEIAVDGAHIDGSVWGVVNGVDATEGADLVGQPGDFADIVNRADGIGASWMSATRMTTPRSSRAFQGEKLASWSRQVKRISSPVLSSRPMARLVAKVSEVMFMPKATSSGSQPKKSAMAWRACCKVRSVRREVS